MKFTIIIIIIIIIIITNYYELLIIITKFLRYSACNFTRISEKIFSGNLRKLQI